MNTDTIKKIALEIGALKKVSNMVFINFEAMKNFIESSDYVEVKPNRKRGRR